MSLRIVLGKPPSTCSYWDMCIGIAFKEFYAKALKCILIYTALNWGVCERDREKTQPDVGICIAFPPNHKHLVLLRLIRDVCGTGNETRLSWWKAAAQITSWTGIKSFEIPDVIKDFGLSFWKTEIRQFYCLQHWHLDFPAPSRTAHLRRKKKKNLFSSIIHDFTPGYTNVSTSINCNLMISGLSYWFTTIRRGPSLPVFTSCRSYSGPHDVSIFIYGVQIDLVKAVEKVYFLALLLLQTGKENYLRRCSCKYQKAQDHLEREETRQRLSPFSCRVMLHHFNYIVKTSTSRDLFWGKVRDGTVSRHTASCLVSLGNRTSGPALLVMGFHQRQCYPACHAAKQLQSGSKTEAMAPEYSHTASSSKADCSSRRQNKLGPVCKTLDRHPKINIWLPSDFFFHSWREQWEIFQIFANRLTPKNKRQEPVCSVTTGLSSFMKSLSWAFAALCTWTSYMLKAQPAPS